MSTLEAAVGEALGEPVVTATGAGGGDINRAVRMELAGGTSVFVKYRAGAPPGTYAVEADGLGWLAEAGALRVPRVLGVGDAEEPRFLALEWIDRGRAGAGHDEALGRGLAALHEAGAETFGYRRDNLIGSIPQPNGQAPDWATFYGERRLLAMTRRAVEHGRLEPRMLGRIERLARRLPDLLGPEEPPSRLHGDLWSGNAIVDDSGAPVIIDPAVYGGHREVDLAMMRLFGGFSERVFAAYEDVVPLAPGAPERVRLLQLYPLLVHVVLFGGSYAASVERAVSAYE